jgi:hypothetical protein
MLNNPSPLPLKKPLPDGMVIFPLTKREPVKVEPFSIESTLNPSSGVTDAVIEPVDNLVACGKLNISLPSPKKEPVNELLIDCDAVISFTIMNLLIQIQ